MVVECHYVACGCVDRMKIPILKKRGGGGDWDFLLKIGKKPSKFHWEWGRNSAHEP